MIRKVIPLLFLFLGNFVSAQVGIGTREPNPASALDIVAKDKGILLPRIQLHSEQDKSAIVNPEESLLVYNTGSTSLVAGFYYWSNAKWTQLLAGDTYIDTKNQTFTIEKDSNDIESLVITDTQGGKVFLAISAIAKNNTFVTNLVENQDFITKLGDNIEFVNHITNNEDFITNIVNELKGKYGNVNYNATTNKFVYYDENGGEHDVDWSDFNTTNVSFTLVNDKLVVTDSDQNKIELAVTDIASNKTFVEHIATNQDFITKLGDNIEFVNHITNNEDFITNIVNELKGKYGNVNYNATTNKFVYYDENGGEHDVDWSDFNTTNVSFTLVNDKLVVTDSDQNKIELAVTDIATNKTFVEHIATNQDFITKLGDNIEFVNHITNNEDFITNIVNELKGKFGNVNYNATTNKFVYYDENGGEHDVDWSDFNTTNVSFTLVNDKLVVTDSDQNKIELAVTDIASNKTFVEHIATNQDFITKLGDNIEFINHITNNEDFITNIVNELKGKYGNVNYNATTNKFVYYDENGGEHDVDWSDFNTTNVSFTLVNDKLVVTDSDQNKIELAVTDIASNKTFVEHIATNQDFITKLGDNIEFVNHITNNEDFITNVINTLRGKYGNVNYNPTTNTFVYYDEQGVEHEVDWSTLNTTNVSFTLVNDKLVVTDLEQNVVELAVTDIATNKTFVEQIATNQDFITKLGDNIEFVNHITNNEDFITNIVNELKGKYGNVGFDVATNSFFYYDADYNVVNISWESLGNTKVKSFVIDEVNNELVITDTEDRRFPVAIDDLGRVIANNDVFVTNLVDNKTFTTKLGNDEHFVTTITNNEDFITNIITELRGKYGNVNYNPTTNTFVYYDEQGVEHDVDWSSLNTTNVSFTLVNDKLVVTDSDQNVVELAVTDIASNKTFVEQIATNQDFITKLGDNIDFLNHITNNEDFITNIITELRGKYGNVNYNPTTNTFVYYDEQGVEHDVDWSTLNTTNVSFTLVNDKLVVTDSEQNAVELAVTDIASNKTFVEHIATNQDFITKLGDNIDFLNHITNNEDFITNIITELRGKYGNVNYNPTTNTFVYYDEQGVEHDVDWSTLNTTNVSFTLVNDKLVVTDSDQNVVELAVTDIASNKTFVEHIATNQDFITKLGDNLEFINHITNNEDFITNIITELRGKYGNVNYNPTTNTFVYYDEQGVEHDVDWSTLNTTNVSFTLVNDKLVVTDSEQNVVELEVTDIASNKTFVEQIATNQDFITKLGDNTTFITTIVDMLKGKYGNVGFDVATNSFFYYDADYNVVDISWESLGNTKVKSFAIDEVNNVLVITDTENNRFTVAIDDLGRVIANNDVFVTNLVDNKTFTTKLGNDEHFVTTITNNEDFITNIITELRGKYGNVNYNPTTNTFVYYDEQGVEHDVDWSTLNTTNVSFTLVNDKLVVTDSDQNVVELAVTDIASNKTFVEQIATNQDFITKLGDNIDFLNHITNNEDFITNIITELRGKYGNVNYNPTTNTFVYYDEQGVEHDVDWSTLNTTNVSFTLVNDKLVVTDSDQNVVELAVTDIASNKTFVEQIATNQDFITKLGDNLEFINHITSNEDFITNIITELRGKYGNVNYNPTTNTFVYYDEQGVEHDVDWSTLNTINVSFTLVNDKLVVTDSEQNVVELAVTDIASNKTFVEQIATNQDFITKLGDNTTFITTIVDMLKGKYGNVGFDVATNSFFYYDADYNVVDISWESLGNTKVKSFAIDEVNNVLVITDTENNRFTVAIDDLGRVIANNEVFVTNLVDNKTFTTKLGNDEHFVTTITSNEDFITNIITELRGKYGNVNYNPTTNTFVYYDEQGVEHDVDWSTLNTINVSFTLVNDKLVVTDSDQNVVELAVTDIASNKTFVEQIATNQDFITKLGDNLEFINHITNNEDFITNIITELSDKYGNVSYDGTSFTYVDATGIHVIDLEAFVKDNETITTLANVDGVLTYTNEANVPVVVDIPTLVKSNETLTVLENVVTQEEDEHGQELDIYTLTYKDENGVAHPIDIKVLVKGTETLTTLVYDPIAHILTYSNENGEKTILELTDLVGDGESLTKLEFDPNTNSLLYTDENQIIHTIEIESINKHPWYDSSTQKVATSNTANIYTKGWVGIGFTEPSDAPSEKLRVNGSITAVNSYYADYVFEKYFDGYSSLKYDYNFKGLDAVEDFIKENRHLPGITPIHELNKSEEGYSFNVSELSIQLLEKTEELYLHIIEQNKELEEKESRIKELEQANQDVQQKVEQLEKMLLDFMQKN